MVAHGSKRKNQRTLADLARHQEATVEHLDLPPDLTSRLMDLGFVPGTLVAATHSAPGGDPRVFRIDGTEIALRRETARHIRIQHSTTDVS
ncbi:MAG: ferrous iron transport protein A [Bryobacterales bacterium]|nr:ferrous iron transport protein A [Bryobacterales bacterium]